MIHHLSSALPSSGIESSSSSIGVKESTTLRLVVCPSQNKRGGRPKINKSSEEVRYLFYNSPGGTSQGVVYSGREVKLMNSILRLNPLALWEGAA